MLYLTLFFVIIDLLDSETFCYPIPDVKFHLSEVKFWLKSIFFTSSTTFFQKRFLCVKLQYLVSTYLQLDCLYLKKQIYSETFCYPTPM